jgi:hypothetical protein
MRTVTYGLAHAPVVEPPRAIQPTLEQLGFTDCAEQLREELLVKVRATARHRWCQVAYVVRADGVEVVERGELARHYQRHGLRPLALRIRQSPLLLGLVVLEGEPETAVVPWDFKAWLATGGLT